jgi:hypothetical protein
MLTASTRLPSLVSDWTNNKANTPQNTVAIFEANK